MNAKQVNQFVKGLYNANFSTLSGAVKTFTDSCKSADKAKVEEMAKEINITISEARKLSAFCRNRSAVLNACKAMLPTIDGTICEFKVVAKDYRQKDMTGKSFNNISSLKDGMLIGKSYKPYGYEAGIVELIPSEPNYILKESDIASTTYAPFPVDIFMVKKVAKATIDYIRHCEKNGIDWNKVSSNNANA